MKRLISFIVVLMFGYTAHAVVLTEEQANNLDLLHKEVKKVHSGFVGFNGPKYAPQSIGVSESDAQSIINGCDISQLKKDDPKRKERKKTRNKLKSLGLSNDEIDDMGLKNDIAD